MYFNFVIFVKALLKCNVRCWNFEKHSPKWLDASRIRIFTINPHLVCNIHKKQTNTRKTYNTVTMLTPKLQRIKKTLSPELHVSDVSRVSTYYYNTLSRLQHAKRQTDTAKKIH